GVEAGFGRPPVEAKPVPRERLEIIHRDAAFPALDGGRQRPADALAARCQVAEVGIADGDAERGDRIHAELRSLEQSMRRAPASMCQQQRTRPPALAKGKAPSPEPFWQSVGDSRAYSGLSSITKAPSAEG